MTQDSKFIIEKKSIGERGREWWLIFKPVFIFIIINNSFSRSECNRNKKESDEVGDGRSLRRKSFH